MQAHGSHVVARTCTRCSARVRGRRHAYPGRTSSSLLNRPGVTARSLGACRRTQPCTSAAWQARERRDELPRAAGIPGAEPRRCGGGGGDRGARARAGRPRPRPAARTAGHACLHTPQPLCEPHSAARGAWRPAAPTRLPPLPEQRAPRAQARLGKAIAHWRAKAAAAAREWAARNAALAEERGAAARSHRALKAALECFRAQQAERMRELSVRRSGTWHRAQGIGHHPEPFALSVCALASCVCRAREQASPQVAPPRALCSAKLCSTVARGCQCTGAGARCLAAWPLLARPSPVCPDSRLRQQLRGHGNTARHCMIVARLSTRSAAVEGTLRERLATAERILRLAAHIRKAEAEAERALPLGAAAALAPALDTRTLLLAAPAALAEALSLAGGAMRAARAGGACLPCLPRARSPTCQVLDDAAEGPPAAAGAAPASLTGLAGPVRSRPPGVAVDSPVEVLGLGPGVGAVTGPGGGASMLADLAALGLDSELAAAAVESGLDGADAWQLVSARGACGDAAEISVGAAAGAPPHFVDALAAPLDATAPHGAGVQAALKSARAASPDPDDEGHDAHAEAADGAAGAPVEAPAASTVPGLPPARQHRAGDRGDAEGRTCSEHPEAAGDYGSLDHELTSGAVSLLLEPSPVAAAAGGLDQAGAATGTAEAHAEVAPGELVVCLEPPGGEASSSVIKREDATDGAESWSERGEGGEMTEGAVTTHALASLPGRDQDEWAACSWQQAGRSSGRCHALDEHGQPVPHARMLEHAYRRFNKARLDHVPVVAMHRVIAVPSSRDSLARYCQFTGL